MFILLFRVLFVPVEEVKNGCWANFISCFNTSGRLVLVCCIQLELVIDVECRYRELSHQEYATLPRAKKEKVGIEIKETSTMQQKNRSGHQPVIFQILFTTTNTQTSLFYITVQKIQTSCNSIFSCTRNHQNISQSYIWWKREKRNCRFIAQWK